MGKWISSGNGEIWEEDENRAQEVEYRITLGSHAKSLTEVFGCQLKRSDRPRFTITGQIFSLSGNAFKDSRSVFTLRLESQNQIEIRIINTPCLAGYWCDFSIVDYSNIHPDDFTEC